MEVRLSGEVKVAVIVPRFDAYTSKDVEATLSNLIQGGANKLLCNFSGTEYIASAGLRVLLSIAKSLQRSKGQMAICSLKPYVYEVFETAGFTQIFKIYSSEEEAIKNLASDSRAGGE